LIVEKDYEILSIVYIGSNNSFHEKGDLLTDVDNIQAWEEGSAREFWSINSIKRLSDGEVFSIGDTVRDSSTDHLTNNKIQIIGCIINYEFNAICLAESGTSMPVRTINKVKKLLFTT